MPYDSGDRRVKVGDLAIVLPYEVKLRARWNNEARSEDYIGQCGTVSEIMVELCGQPLIQPQVVVAVLRVQVILVLVVNQVDLEQQVQLQARQLEEQVVAVE